MAHQPFNAAGASPAQQRTVTRSPVLRPAMLSLALATAFSAQPINGQTLPTGGVAVHGQAVISSPSPQQLVVTTQNGPGSGHSAINWQSFSISAGSSARINQPSAASLSINRVVTQNPSAIFGNLSSNGRLVLVNPSGITVGAGAIIDTAGFTASALRMGDADALAGRLRFGDAVTAMGGAAGITVEGHITARDGDVVLIAPQIGVGASALVQAPNGSTILAAGQQVEITGRGLEGISMLVQARDNEARNLGRLEGDAVGIFAGTLRHSGEIQAMAATVDGGKVVLKGAEQLAIDGTVRALGSSGKGGQIHATANTVTLASGATLDASGSSGGGEVLVGGGWQGSDARLANAHRTIVTEGARISADATADGDGGTVVIWADLHTGFAGHISARGGADGGDGGRAEVSGLRTLDFQGQVDLRAPTGRTGALLLDPANITIGLVADVNGDSSTGDNVSGNIAVGDFGPIDSQITAAQVSTLLNTSNLTLAASNNIAVIQPITKTTGTLTTLTLDAGNLVLVNAAISGSPGAPLGVTLNSGGNIDILQPINTFGGDFTAAITGPGTTMTVRNLVDAATMNVSLLGGLEVQAGGLRATGNQTISASGILLQAGSAGGSLVTLASAANQSITVGDGGLTLLGGGGALTGNSATIEQNGGAGTSQSITVNGTGSIVITGGSSALTGTDPALGSIAAIKTEIGDNQTITFTGTGLGRTITLTGGTVGSNNLAEIYAGVGTQSITGAGLITLTGGASGGGASFPVEDTTGNVAAIGADSNNQTIVASGLVLQGGAAGLNNLAIVYGGGDQSITVGASGLQLLGGGGGLSDFKNAALVFKGSDVPGTSQTITVGGGGAIVLQGGNATASNVGIDANLLGLSNGAFAAIRSEGIAQLIEFTAPNGSIQMTGGTVGSDNHAMILAQTGSQAIRGSSAVNAPTLVLDGGASGGVGGAANEGNRALIFSRIGNQDVTARLISLTGGVSGNENLAQIRQGDASNGLASTQSVTMVGGGDITMQGGNGNTNFARIRAFGTTQTVDFSAGGAIDLTGGGGGIDSFAQIIAHNGDQFVTGADQITLLGGSAGNNNRAQITAILGSQTLTIGAGGLSMTGGSGAPGELANFASVFQGGTVGKSQAITIGGGGDIVLQAGSSAGTNVGLDNGSLAYITSQGDSQLIEFSGAGSLINITGGTVGSRNEAGILASNGSQTIRGTSAANAPAITLTGGASGGAAGEGNLARIWAPTGNQFVAAASLVLEGGIDGTENRAAILADAGNQFVSAASLHLQGGAGGSVNLAQIRQGDIGTGLANTQTIELQDGASNTILGGGGVTNLARIQSHGTSQTVDLGTGGSMDLIGGTGASFNFARIEALNGDQFITGSSAITIIGGASGGAATTSTTGGNFADLRQRNTSKIQSVAARSLTIMGGAAGTENNAGIQADGDQVVSLQTAGANTIVIGDAATPHTSYITGKNQVVTAGNGAQLGSITIVGGTGTGKNAGIFANPTTPNTGTQTISTTGTLSLTGGTGTGTASTCNPATGGGACADINNDGTGLQTITANAIQLQGGSAGLSSGAGIFSQGGNMVLNVGAGGLTLLGGAGGTSNFASIGGGNASGATLTINVTGDTLLDSRNGSDGNGAIIGLGGTGVGGTITIDFNGTGNLSIFGSNVSPTLAGSGIGTGSNRTGATANITVDAATVTLTSGSQSRAQIGHKLGNGGLGDITINATGNIVLNSVGALSGEEAAVRTGGNVTLAAGGSITQSADASIEANLLTANANGGSILLDSTANAVGILNATVPFFNTGDILFTNGPGLTLGVSGIAMAGTGRTARITADDIQITGAVSNIGGTVVLRPLDLTRDVHIETTPTAGVLSLSPAELQLVTNATVLEIGRLDGTGDLQLVDSLANNQVNAGALRLLAGNDFQSASGASLGQVGAEFNHLFEVRANNNLLWGTGSVFLANNRDLRLYADNDGSGVGFVGIEGTLKVGTDAGNTSGQMDVKGDGVTVLVSGGRSALLEVTGAGNQTFTATDRDVTFDNLNATVGVLNVLSASGIQTFSVANGVLFLGAGNNTGNSVTLSAGGTQVVNANAVMLQGGFGGSNNSAVLFASGNAQTISAGAGGISLNGGSGTGGDGNNSAIITYSGTGTQNISIAAGGDLSLTGGSSAAQNVGAGNGSRAIIESSGTGNQSITLTGGDLTLQGGSVGSRNYAALFADLGSQTISGVNNLLLHGGNDGGVATEGNRATVHAGVNQSISATSIALIGGDDGTENYARILLYGPGALTQTVNADAITLNGGIAGGGLGTGNFALIQSEASQAVNVANGGDLTLTGGGGTLTDNAARIETTGGIGTQAITLTGGGSITLAGGSSTATTVGATHGSRAIINANATAQTIDAGGGTILMIGGTAGQRNFAGITAQAGNQTISNAATIQMTGGAAGGVAGEGNFAVINSETGNQSITAGSIVMTGGAAGTENLAQIRQGAASTGLSASQAINVSGTGALLLSGGAGNANFARIQAFGVSQTVTMGSSAALALTGGTGANNNLARIQAVNGNQTINGNPFITISGGASGGADLAGNAADIRASGPASIQTINAGNLVLQAGAAGQENFAAVLAPNQNITSLLDVSLTGGGAASSLDGTSGGGARIGGIGGASPTATNLTLTVGNDLTLTGGSVAGVLIGSNQVGGQTTTIIIDAGGDITLNPGTSTTAGARIGSPAAGLAGGDIILSAGGAITLGGSVAGETAIRTLGDVTLDASTLAIGNLVAGSTIFASATGTAAITGVGQLNASALSGDAIELVTGTSFSNSAGASALVTTAPARWLVYSSDPALDVRGGLVYDFKQYDKVFGDATAILGSGNGFLYSIAPTATVSLTGTVSKVYDGSTTATLVAGNFLASGGIDGDTVSVGVGATGSYDNRNVGTGKTVSVSGVTISASDGTAPDVYGYALAGGTASGAVGTITAAPLTVSTGDVNKTYDATTAAPGAAATVSTGSLFGGDTLSGGSFAFLDPNAGIGKTVTVSGVTVNDGNGGLNYTLTLADNTTSSIAAANLTLGTSDVIKTYDATTSAAGSLIVTGGSLFGNDNVSGGSFAFADKNAGVGKTVTTSGATVADGNGGANYNVSYASNTNSTINRADISNVTGIVANDKVYDGSTNATLVTSATGFIGVIAGDTLNVAGATGNFSDRNAGIGKTVNVSAIMLGGTDAGNYNLLDPTSSTFATISRADITISTTAVTKPYDGNTSAAGSAVVTSGALVAGDTLGSASFVFVDRNTGTGKTVNVTSALINDGFTGANYNVTLAPNLLSSITALASATWSGSAGDSLWSSASNWDVAPETGNVLSVTIPSGSGNVVFDATAGTTSLQSLTSARPFSITGGNLQIGSLLQTASYSQSGTSSLSGSGSLIVTDSFTQTGGSIALGAININQAVGNLTVGDLSAPVMALSAPAGMITQSGSLTGGGALVTASQTGSLLTSTGNQIGALSATNAGSGDIVFVNTGTLAIQSLANAGGNINVVNTGGVTTSGAVLAPAGNVHITANSPLTIGAGGITAGGDIVLNATNLTSAGDLTLNGILTAGNIVDLTAGSAMVQNFAVFGANGVTANAGTSMLYGPLAITNNPPVLYAVAGVAVTPPPTVLASSLQAPGDILVTFLDLFQQAISGDLGGLLELDADGNLRRKLVDGVVSEEELCR